MSTEDQLRQKFARLVPEAPDSVTEADPIEARARSARRRRTVVVSLAAAAAVVAVGIPSTIALGHRDRSPGGGVASNPTAPGSAAPDPMTVDPCPSGVRQDTYAADPVPAGLVSVRICDLPDTWRWAATTAPMDAMVTDLPGFRADLDALPAADPAECISTTPAPPSSVMLLTGPDGTRAQIPVMACATVEVGTRQVTASAVHALLLQRLSDQRTASTATQFFAVPDACRSAPTDVLLEPSREVVQGGQLCRPGQAPRTLNEDEVALLQKAWSEAVRGSDYQREDRCHGVTSRERIALTTDFGDVVQFEFDGCGDYVQTAGPRPWHLLLDGPSLDRLGLTQG